jgi:hypothetical protein
LSGLRQTEKDKWIPQRNNDCLNRFSKEDASGTGRIDLYKRGCFVLETKQGVDRHVSADPYLKTPKLTRKGHAVRGTGG